VRGLREICGFKLWCTVYDFYHQQEPGLTINHTFLVTDVHYCQTIYFFGEMNLIPLGYVCQTLLYKRHHPGVFEPFWEPWTAGQTGTYPWTAHATPVTHIHFPYPNMEMYSEGWGWGPFSTSLRLAADIPGSPLPLPLPRFLVAYHAYGLPRTPFFSAIKLRFQPIFGHVVSFWFCLEWPFGDRDHVWLFGRWYRKIPYDILAIDLNSEWQGFLDFRGWPSYTPHPVINEVQVCADVSGSIVTRLEFLRQGFFGLLDEMPPDWPWLRLE